MYLCMYVIHVEVRGQLVGLSSPLQPCGSEGFNSDHQVQWQTPLFTEPSSWLFIYLSGSHSAAQGGLKLTTLLTQTAKC